MIMGSHKKGTYFWLCSQGKFLVRLRGSYNLMGIRLVSNVRRVPNLSCYFSPLNKFLREHYQLNPISDFVAGAKGLVSYVLCFRFICENVCKWIYSTKEICVLDINKIQWKLILTYWFSDYPFYACQQN